MIVWLRKDVGFVQSEGIPIQVQSGSQSAVPDGPAYLSVTAYEEAGEYKSWMCHEGR